MSDVAFRGNGGPLEVELICGEAQIGTYSLRLVEPDEATVVRHARGSFIDDEEDRYPLPLPAASNDRRLLKCRARLWIIPPHNKYSVIMRVRQDGTDLGEDEDHDTTNLTTLIVPLEIRLIAT